jgi:glutathione S-transferase
MLGVIAWRGTMIELHEFAPVWGINPSPFCIKVETYLRLTGLAFRPVVSVPMRAPKRKLPFIRDGGRAVADSGFIIEYLQQAHQLRLDEGLQREQRALGHLMRRTCEESLYFVLLYSRWIDDPGWMQIRQNFLAGMAGPLRVPLLQFIRRSTRQMLRAQGYGRHSRDEIYALGAADLEALAAQLETRAYAVADRPSSFDATLHAFLLSVLRPPIENPLRGRALALPSLGAYVERMEAGLAPGHPNN